MQWPEKDSERQWPSEEREWPSGPAERQGKAVARREQSGPASKDQVAYSGPAVSSLLLGHSVTKGRQ
jgi:hypothetical protein